MENNASCREKLQCELTECLASKRLKESNQNTCAYGQQKQKLPRVRLRGCMEGGRGRDGEGERGGRELQQRREIKKNKSMSSVTAGMAAMGKGNRKVFL